MMCGRMGVALFIGGPDGHGSRTGEWLFRSDIRPMSFDIHGLERCVIRRSDRTVKQLKSTVPPVSLETATPVDFSFEVSLSCESSLSDLSSLLQGIYYESAARDDLLTRARCTLSNQARGR
jgi:hypothetical protein